MKGASAREFSPSRSQRGQHQDTGAKMIHAADETTSNIISN